MNFLSAEELITWLANDQTISLSRYDKKFFQNILYIILDKNEITTNQLKLYERLLDKYKRQFYKHKINTIELQNLPWKKTKIVQSAPTFTEPRFELHDDKLYLYSPFNKKFIEQVHKHNIIKIEWKKEERRYEAPFYTIGFKLLLAITQSVFSVIHFDEQLEKVMLEAELDGDYFEPTVVEIDNHLYIAGTNQVLNEAIKHIKLEYTLPCFANLRQYGISFSPKVKDKMISMYSAEDYNFAVSDTIKFDVNNPEHFKRLKSINCDLVIVFGLLRNMMVPKFDIPVHVINNYFIADEDFNKIVADKQMVVCLTYNNALDQCKVAKYLQLVNSAIPNI